MPTPARHEVSFSFWPLPGRDEFEVIVTPRVPKPWMPWEVHVGCPKCKAKPNERCTIVKPVHMDLVKRGFGRDTTGLPTSAHAVRYKLYCYLWRIDPTTGRKLDVEVEAAPQA